MKSKPSSKNSDSSAMVCVVFAVAAVETFLDDPAKRAFSKDNDDTPSYGEQLYGMGELIRRHGECKISIARKNILDSEIFDEQASRSRQHSSGNRRRHHLLERARILHCHQQSRNQAIGIKEC